MQHDLVADEMAIIGYQDPMMQKMKDFLGKMFVLLLFEPLRSPILPDHGSIQVDQLITVNRIEYSVVDSLWRHRLSHYPLPQ